LVLTLKNYTKRAKMSFQLDAEPVEAGENPLISIIL